MTGTTGSATSDGSSSVAGSKILIDSLTIVAEKELAIWASVIECFHAL